MLQANMNILCFIQRLNVLHWGAEEARRNESSLLALDTITMTNLLHALRGPDAPSEDKDRFFWVAVVRSGGLFLSYTGGVWWLCSWTSVPEDLWQHCTRQENIGFVCILVFAEMSHQLAFPSDICPVSCHWFNYCLLDFISFFFFPTK